MSEPSLERAESVSNPAPVRQLSCFEALREQRGDVRCFTPALLVAFAHLPVDPAQDFMHRFPAPANLQPFCVELPPNAPPFFADIPPTVLHGRLIDWNRRLYAIAAERAKECFDFMAGLGVSGNNNFFASSVMYETTIPDPLSFSSIRSTLDVTVFGVFSNDKITYLAPEFNVAPKVRTISADRRLELNLGFKVDDYIDGQFKALRNEE